MPPHRESRLSFSTQRASCPCFVLRGRLAMLRDEVVDEGLQSYFAFLLNESAYDIRRHRFSTTIAHSSLRASKLLRRNRDSDLCGGHTRIIPRRSWLRKQR